MNEADKHHHEARAQIIKSLAHPSRLCILAALAEGERCVCELRDEVGADMSTVSKHLSLLKNAGIISSEKRGLNVIYRLSTPCVLNFLGCIENVVKANAKRQMAACGLGTVVTPSSRT
jgi:ArsR family transcriptional regulator